MVVLCPGRSLLGRRVDRHHHGGQEELDKPCTRRREGAEKKMGRLGGLESEGKKVSSTSTYLAGLGGVSRRSKAEDKIGKIEM